MAGERTLSSLSTYRKRYKSADRRARGKLLDEFCATTQYHRKYAIRLLGLPADTPEKPAVRRRRGVSYGPEVARALAYIWEAAGYPWSVRLKALLPQWLPFARRHLPGLSATTEAALLAISPRQMDRLLADRKRRQRKRLYGHTKPGTLLRRQIPIRTDNWDVNEPGYLEIDLVAHCGQSATGEFVYSLDVTDVFSGWTQTRAILGKGEAGVVEALEEIRRELPFKLVAIDSDNGSEFINHHLVKWCKKHGVKFTRSRPYKKNDNAHIEQKNWTHVRKIFGWERYDTQAQREAMNVLYRGELQLMENLFQPSVKLVGKERIGGKLRRKYDEARTPLDRLAEHYGRERLPVSVQRLLREREKLDPFALSSRVNAAVSRLMRGEPSAAKKRGAV